MESKVVGFAVVSDVFRGSEFKLLEKNNHLIAMLLLRDTRSCRLCVFQYQRFLSWVLWRYGCKFMSDCWQLTMIMSRPVSQNVLTTCVPEGLKLLRWNIQDLLTTNYSTRTTLTLLRCLPQKEHSEIFTWHTDTPTLDTRMFDSGITKNDSGLEVNLSLDWNMSNKVKRCQKYSNSFDIKTWNCM